MPLIEVPHLSCVIMRFDAESSIELLVGWLGVPEFVEKGANPMDHVENQIKKYPAWVVCALLVLLSMILRSILSSQFSLSRPGAFSLSWLITLFVCYPLVAHRIEYRKSFWNRSGRPWSLSQYSVLNIGFSVTVYVVGKYFDW